MKKAPFTNILQDERILLERIKLEHQDEMFAIIDSNRNTLRPWLNWVDKMRTPKDFSKYVKDRVDWWNICDMFTYVTKVKIDNNQLSPIVGMISFKEIDWDNQTGAFVLWLDKSARGQGLANAMYDLVSQEAFRKGFKTVQSHIDSRNIASIKSIERSGEFSYIETRTGEPDHIDPSINIEWMIFIKNNHN